MLFCHTTRYPATSLSHKKRADKLFKTPHPTSPHQTNNQPPYSPFEIVVTIPGQTRTWGQYTLSCRLSWRIKKYSLQAITASERGKRRGAEAAADSHLIKCPICSGKCHMCSAGSWGYTPQHSFSLTSAAAPEVETQDLQCWGLARSTGSFIYHWQTYTTMIQPRCVCSGFNTNYSMKFDRVQPVDWGYTHLIAVYLQFNLD